MTRLAVDLGAEVTKVAIARDGSPPVVLTQRTGSRSRREALAAALSLASSSLASGAAASGDPVGTRAAGGEGSAPLTAFTPVTLAVPDSWLDGTASGGRRQEDVRHLAEDELGLRAVTWAGQLAAAAAVTASQGEPAEPGTYLVCDIGGRGVRAASCEVTGRAVRQRAVRVAVGGGWRDFDAAVRLALGGGAETEPAVAQRADPEQTVARPAIGRPERPGGPAGLPGDWHSAAERQDRRAKVVLARALADPAFRDARAYTLGSFHELTAGQVIDCFEPAARRLRECATAVLSGHKPRVTVLTGGLAWLPLAAGLLRDMTGTDPVILGADAAARGALLLAGEPDIGLAHKQHPVSLPMNQVRDGMLAEASQPLPWTWSFPPGGESFQIEEPLLTLDISGQRVTLPVPGLASGRYRIGVRPGWSGDGVLVVRASPGYGVTLPSADVHVLPLDIPA
jgi:hypothetical protein